LGGLVLSLFLKNYGDKEDRKLAQDIAGFSAGLVVDDFVDLVDDVVKFLKKHFNPDPYYL